MSMQLVAEQREGIWTKNAPFPSVCVWAELCTLLFGEHVTSQRLPSSGAIWCPIIRNHRPEDSRGRTEREAL
jgi:hypothetical protein